MIDVIKTALSGLNASSQKLAASASNIANIDTVGSLEDGGQAPYTPLTTTQSTGVGGGVTSKVVPKNNPFYSAYSPDSRFADENGIIGVPNVDLAEEAVNSKIAEITYKANIKVIKAAEEMSDDLLSLVDKKA